MQHVTRIFTDGSAIGNPGPGGWAAVVLHDRQRYEMAASEPWTTIQAMELFAAVRALSLLPAGSRIELCSDSEYLIKGMRTFVFRWINQGWKNRQGKKLQDQALWEQLLILNQSLYVDWQWIRGHNGHPEQTRADDLAYRAARSICDSQRAA